MSTHSTPAVGIPEFAVGTQESAAGTPESATADCGPGLGPIAETAQAAFSLPAEARAMISAGGLVGDHGESLVQWLATDRSLADRLLRWCNTPLFNLATPYESLDQASAVLEPTELPRLALLAHVREWFLPDAVIDIYRRESLWRHSMAVAAVGSMISRTCGLSDAGTVFLAGALHDIGICIGERVAPEAFRDVVGQIDELSPTCEVEQERLGWDHCELGESILSSWGMPDDVRASARWHHQPKAALAGPHGETVGCVAIANYLCSRSGWSSMGAHNVTAPRDAVFSCLGIDAGLLTVLWQQLGPVLDAAGRIG